MISCPLLPTLVIFQVSCYSLSSCYVTPIFAVVSKQGNKKVLVLERQLSLGSFTLFPTTFVLSYNSKNVHKMPAHVSQNVTSSIASQSGQSLLNDNNTGSTASDLTNAHKHKRNYIHNITIHRPVNCRTI